MHDLKSRVGVCLLHKYKYMIWNYSSQMNKLWVLITPSEMSIYKGWIDHCLEIGTYLECFVSVATSRFCMLYHQSEVPNFWLNLPLMQIIVKPYNKFKFLQISSWLCSTKCIYKSKKSALASHHYVLKLKSLN